MVHAEEGDVWSLEATAEGRGPDVPKCCATLSIVVLLRDFKKKKSYCLCTSYISFLTH